MIHVNALKASGILRTGLCVCVWQRLPILTITNKVINNEVTMPGYIQWPSTSYPEVTRLAHMDKGFPLKPSELVWIIYENIVL